LDLALRERGYGARASDRQQHDDPNRQYTNQLTSSARPV
jgi:hypothetical protein